MVSSLRSVGLENVETIGNVNNACFDNSENSNLVEI